MKKLAPRHLQVGGPRFPDSYSTGTKEPRNRCFSHHLILNNGKWLFKTRQGDQNRISYAKPHVTKPRLINSFGSPRCGLSNQSFRNHLGATSQGICLIDPFCRLVQLPRPCFPSAYKSIFMLVQLLKAPFICEIGCKPIHESLNKANQIFKIDSVELFCHVINMQLGIWYILPKDSLHVHAHAHTYLYR